MISIIKIITINYKFCLIKTQHHQVRFLAGSKLQEEPIEMPLFYYNACYFVYCSITLLFSALFLLMFKLRLLIANQIKESFHSFDWFKNYVIKKNVFNITHRFKLSQCQHGISFLSFVSRP